MLRAGDFRGACARCEKVMEPALVYPQDPDTCEFELPPCDLCGQDPSFTSWHGKAVCRLCRYIYAD